MQEVNDTPVSRKRTAVFWKPHEFDKVADRWIHICEDLNEDPTAPTTPLIRIVYEAQQVLPSNKHRPRTSLMGTKNNQHLMDVVKARIEKRKKQADESEPEPSPQPLQLTAEALTNTQNPRLVFRQLPSTQEADDEHQPLEALLEDFASNVATMIVSLTMKQLKEGFKREFPKLHLKAHNAVNIAPKILVVGPLGKQQEDLEASVKGLVDLKFVSSEEGARLVGLRGASCVACLLWTDFISHSHQDAAYRLFPRESVKMVNGRNLQSLKDTLEEISLQLVDEA